MRARADRRRRPRRADPRGRRRRVLARLRLPEGRESRAAPRRPRPPSRAARPRRRRRAPRGDLARGVRARRRAARADPRRARPRRRRHLHRQPDGPEPLRQPLSPRVPQGARHEAAVHGRHGRPAPEVARERAPLRDAVQRRRAGPRPHRPPAAPRREPGRLAGQPRRGARHPHPSARHPGARRPDRRDRPAPDAHGARGGRAPLRAPRDGRVPARRDRRDALRGGARRAGPARGARLGARRRARLLPALPAGAGRRALRDRGDRRAPPRARPRRGRAGGRLRALRDDDAGVRGPRRAGSSTSSTCSRATSTARRRDVLDPCDGRPDVQRPAAHRARHRGRPLALPRRRGPRGARGAHGRRARRGDRDGGAGAGARARHVLGEPGPLVPERHAARRGPCDPRLLRRARPVRQRDDASRARDPPAPVAARAGALPRRRLPDGPAERRELLAARPPAAGGDAGRVGDDRPPDRDRLGARTGGRRRRARPRPRARDAPTADGRPVVAGRGTRSRRAARGCSSPGGGRSGCSTSCSAAARTATASARGRTG